MTKPIVKVCIGIPDKGITDYLSYDNHLEFMHRLGQLQVRSESDLYPAQFKFFLTVIGRVFPALARERLAEFAVEETDADLLFMWDDDMILPMDLFERLYAHNVDIVAALAFTRLGPYRPVIYNLTSGYDSVMNRDYYINQTVQNYPKDRLVECDAVGFGSVLIKTKVFKGMEKPWFMTTSGAGEDIHFCHTARTRGFRVFVDTAAKLGHVGEPLIVTEEFYELNEEIRTLRKTHEDQAKYEQKGVA
jgi:hypothetical protein